MIDRTEFERIVEERIRLIRSTLMNKGLEYASDSDVLQNFRRAADISFHDDHLKVIWEYMTKHLQSIKDMILEDVPYDGHTVSEKIGDTINYLILLETALYQKINHENSL